MAAGLEGMFGEAQPMPPAAPEPGPGPDRRSARRVIGWVVGFLLLIGVGVLDVANETYKDRGTVAGAFIAAIGLSLLVALGLRFAVVKVSRPGRRYEEIPAAQLEQAREELPFSPEFRQSVEGRLIAANRSPVAVVFVIPVGVGREGRKGYFKGFTERAAEVGARPREIQLGSARGTVVTPSKGRTKDSFCSPAWWASGPSWRSRQDENTLRMAITPVVGG